MTKPDNQMLLESKMQFATLITALLCEPEQEVIGDHTLFDMLHESLVQIHSEPMPEAMQLKKAAIDTDIQSLLVEYARLFVGPYKLPCPPYASCYLGTKELNNEVTAWVRNFYADCGLHYHDSSETLPDHIAVETEFIQYLLGAHLNTLKTDIEKSDWYLLKYNEFLKAHYQKWIPVLGKAVVNETTEPFYALMFKIIGKTSYVL